MNLKKVFASVAGVSMLATAVLPASVLGAASYGPELQGAYDYAFANGITTMSSIDQANMYGELTRGQLAKMISNWAEKEGKATVDQTKVCSFSDANTAEGDLATYLTKACQMGLMGLAADGTAQANFRPNDKVTRGEFGTVLSRALWGNKNNVTTGAFYAKHLEALKAAGIMTKIENPTQLEIRGYVMLMLQRSVNAKTSDVDCKDALVVAACALGNCPAACTTTATTGDNTVVKAGDLAVSAKAAEGRKAIIGGVSDLDTLTFKTSEKVEISKVTLERYGYSTRDQVLTVQLEDEDGNVIADAKELNSKGQVSLSIKKDYKTVNGTYKATVVVKTVDGDTADPKFSNGSTLGFKVVSAESTAKNLNLENYDPYTYDLVKYDGSKVEFSSRNSATKDHNWEANKSFEVAKFRVKAPSDAAILVKGFTLTDSLKNKIEADKYAKDVKVTVNGNEVKGLKWNINKSDELVLSFDEVEVAGKETVTIAVTMSFSEEFDNFGSAGQVQYKVSDITRFNAVDKKTGTRIKESDTKKLGGVTWTTYTFNGGKVKLAGTKLGTVSAAANSTNVLVAQGQITLTEAVRGSVRIANPDTAKNFIEEVTLVVNGEEYDVANKGQANFEFNGVEIEKSGKIELRVDLKDTAKDSLQFASSISSSAFSLKYDVSGETVEAAQISGSISVSTIKAEAPKATLENKLTKEVELIKGETNRKVIFDGTYTAKKGAVNLKSFKITSTAPLAIAPAPTFYVTVNGEEYDATYNKVEDIDNIKVEAGKTVTVKVEVEVVPTTFNGENNTFNIEIIGEDVDNNEAGKADADTVKVKTVTEGSLQLADTANNNTIVLMSNRTVAEFVVKPAKAGSDEVTLKNLVFAYNNVTDADIKVEVDGDVITKSAANTYSPDVRVPAEGVKVKVTLKSEAAKKVTLTLESVNGDDSVKTKFTKYFVPATIKITQRNSGAKTYYSVAVEKDGSDVVKNLELYAGATKLVSSETDVALSANNVDLFSVVNGNTVQDIDKVVYTVGSTTVEVTKSDFADFFKNAGANNDLIVFQN